MSRRNGATKRGANTKELPWFRIGVSDLDSSTFVDPNGPARVVYKPIVQSRASSVIACSTILHDWKKRWSLLCRFVLTAVRICLKTEQSHPTLNTGDRVYSVRGRRLTQPWTSDISRDLGPRKMLKECSEPGSQVVPNSELQFFHGVSRVSPRYYCCTSGPG